MPKAYKPLTAEEKKQIIDRHRYLVDEMNKALPDEMKLQYDADLEKRLDDPNFYGVYRIGMEMKAVREKQAQIRDALEERFGRAANGDRNPLTRALPLAMDVRDTPESTAYNERLYQDYLNDPSKIVTMRYGKLLNVNPKGIFECGDDPLKLAEYYRDNYPQCEEAYNFASVINNGDSTPQMKAALSSLTKPMETISYPVTMMKAATSIDYLACPKLNLEQALMVQAGCVDLVAEAGESLRETIVDYQNKATMESPTTFFGKFPQKGIELEEGMFLNNRPETFELGEDGNAINVKEVSYDRFLNAQPGENVRLSKRSGNDLEQVQAVTRAMQQKYQSKWQENFNKRRGYDGPFDLRQIETQHQGGFFERRIWGSTSPQYSEFIQAFKDFHNPESPNYLNEENLKGKGMAYLQHKADQGYEKLDDMKGTSLIRSKLVMATLETCGITKQNEVKSEYLADYLQHPAVREPFLNFEDVEEEPLGLDEAADELSNEHKVEIDDPNNAI